MDIQVSHARFQKQKLAVRTAGWFSGTKVLLNGVPLKRVKGTYPALADDGTQVPVRLSGAFGDPIPKLRVGEEVVQLAKPLAWYEYAWAALPMLLLFVGGVLGAVMGLFGSYSNFRIFRSSRGGAAKYALSGLSSIITVVVFLALVIAFRLLLGR